MLFICWGVIGLHSIVEGNEKMISLKSSYR